MSTEWARNAVSMKIVAIYRLFGTINLPALLSPTKEWYLASVLILRYRSSVGDGSAGHVTVVPDLCINLEIPLFSW